MLELAEHSLLNRLHEKYFSLARQTTPDKMRSPTINEIRKFDREIFKQALRWKAEKQGEVGIALDITSRHPCSWSLEDA